MGPKSFIIMVFVLVGNITFLAVNLPCGWTPLNPKIDLRLMSVHCIYEQALLSGYIIIVTVTFLL